jgi:hypothetical protein
MNVTDRMVLDALLEVVGELANRLTGEYPMVCLEDDEGNILHVILGVSGVQWFKDPVAARCCIHDEKYFRAKAERDSAAEQAASTVRAD